ncbi:hypothetical protein HYU07_06070 [Candidatus Woesearchaeota archaeon]|nr:hypothetical protein [Candidatus Woesearchaeota archaeon]
MTNKIKFMRVGRHLVRRNDELKIWVEREKIKGISILNKNKSLKLRKKFVKSFLKHGSEKDWDLSMYWDVFNDDSEIFSELVEPKKSIDVVSKLIEKFNFLHQHKIFLMLPVTDDIRIAVFEYKNLNYILGETGLGDIYVFDESFQWTICINHHDFVIFLDKQKQYVEKKEKQLSKEQMKKFRLK